jgi:iron(III) transport system substrate-binding protein
MRIIIIQIAIMIARLSKILTSACLLSLAAIAGAAEVNVYSYRQPFLMKPLFEAFTAETGVKVNTVYAKKGLIERLKREGADSPADVILTVDIGRLNDVKQAGVTQAVISHTLANNIPSNFRDVDNHWFGLTSRARIIVASKDRVAKGTINTYEDLATDKAANKICTRSGKHAYMVALTAAMINHHGEAAAEKWLRGVKSNLARRPQGNDRAQVKAIKEGACDLAVINHYYMVKMLAKEEQIPWANSVYMIFPNQQGRGTHLNVSGIALTKASPNRADAVRLMEWLSGSNAQQIYAEANGEYPVIASVKWSAILESWGKFKSDTLFLSDIANQRKAASKLADKVNYDG